MKRNLICGGAAILFGLLIALGPQFLFKTCGIHDDDVPVCYWAARAEISMGILIAALGVYLIFFTNIKVQLGLTISIFMSGIVAGLIPFDIFFGVCKDTSMVCYRVTLPALTVISALLIIGAVVNMMLLEKKTRS